MKHPFSLLALFCSFAIAPLWTQAQTVPSKVAPPETALVVEKPGIQDIYLMIGQSNMAGCAPIGELDQVPLENVLLFNSLAQWEKATNTAHGMNRYSTVESRLRVNSLNSGYTFGRKVAEYTGRKIGIVSNARGGTRISWWQKGYEGENDFNLYEEAIARTKAALEASPGAQLKGILWHQGEGDNGVQAAALYPAELEKLVASLRADLNAPEAVFIAGEVGIWKGRGMRVNAAIQQIAQHVPRSGFVTSQGLTSINLPKNDPHFDTLSQRVLGGRYADGMLESVYGISPGVVTVYNGPNFTERSVALRAGIYNETELEKRGIKFTELASLKLQAGYKVAIQSSATKATLFETASDANQIPAEAVNIKTPLLVIATS